MAEEETNARALLQEMQRRLAEGPHTALGLPSHATASDIRSAFLQLTKTFHPARFGRMANDVQRLSNEVFLSLRAAHDQLAKSKPSGRPNSTTANPPMRSPTRPFGVPITPATRPGVSPTNPRAPSSPPDRTGQVPPIVLASPDRIGAVPPLRSSSPSTPPPMRTPAPNPTPTTPSSARPNQVQATRTSGAIPVRTAASPSPGARPSGSSGIKVAVPTSTGAQPVRAPSSSSTMHTLDPAIAPFLELIGKGQWDQAQAAIDALVACNPQNKRYDALAAYARGRRAQVEQKFNDARIDLQQALTLDPELELAKSALGELFARRK